MTVQTRTELQDIKFTDNPVARNRPDHYTEITVDTAEIIKSWRESLFSFEWLLPDGRIKSSGELSEAERPRREAVEAAMASQTPLDKPVLGIGMLDNVEIGSGRATFLTLVAHGFKTLPVHIPRTNEADFKKFRV
ncbi:MAG: hypothetical protein HYS17_00140 [Micavibrio aeruginosavorus]|uniref:Uncharacterized protein n=1 Tax=Micavibrio aeruginosavorus TaxID=349221 RepID=A0A7T5R2B2_9BACT|nr:MAG: hypothetical protein HYS17_00140 [Micavibrio aeruginosavorus]